MSQRAVERYDSIHRVIDPQYEVWKPVFTAGLEENGVAERVMVEVPSAVEAKKVVILAGEALRMLGALARLAPADGQPIPLVALASDAEQAQEVRTWAQDLMLEVDVIDISSGAYGATLAEAAQNVSRFYASEKGMTLEVALTLEDLLKVAKFLLVPQAELFTRTELEEIEGKYLGRNL